jgi:hypothetical protein
MPTVLDLQKMALERLFERAGDEPGSCTSCESHSCNGPGHITDIRAALEAMLAERQQASQKEK